MVCSYKGTTGINQLSSLTKEIKEWTISDTCTLSAICHRNQEFQLDEAAGIREMPHLSLDIIKKQHMVLLNNRKIWCGNLPRIEKVLKQNKIKNARVPPLVLSHNTLPR